MATSTGWSTELFNRYHRLHKPYRSYPTAEYFQQPISTFERYSALRTSRSLNRPLALNITMAFCANACYCCSKKTTITKDRSRSSTYLQSLEHEIRLLAQHTHPSQPINELYVSGGTPTFLNPFELQQLMHCLQDNFNLVRNNFSHYSIDIDPRETDWATMGVLRDIGFNCINIMMHALDPTVQRAINRLHNLEQTQKIVEAARTLQFRHISISLLYGLPKQTPQSWAQTLSDTLKLVPDRVHLQGFLHQPHQHPIQQHIAAHDLPSSTDIAHMLRAALEQLTAAGYQYIGMGNFALADDDYTIAQEDDTLHCGLQDYSTYANLDTLGFGAGAISRIGSLHYRNTPDITAYQNAYHNQQLPQACGVVSSLEQSVSEYVIDSLNCQFSVDFLAIQQGYNVDCKQLFAQQWPQLQQMHHDGLLQLSDHALHMTPEGRLFTLAVCQVFAEQQIAEPVNSTAMTQVI